MYRLSFRDFMPDYAEERSFISKHGGLSPAWMVITNKNYGGKKEKQNAMLDWTNRVIDQLLEWREPLMRVWRTNRLIYIGQHYISQEMFDRLPYNKNVRYSKNTAKIVVNYIQYQTEQHVSDLSAYEPNLTCTPMNDEEIDRVAARTKKDILDYYFYEKKVKLRFQKFHRATKVEGESFWFCTWNPELGDYHPSYSKLRKARLAKEQDQTADWSIPLVNPETGQPIYSEDGDPVFLDKPVYVGDIELKQHLAERVLYPYPRSYDWDDVPFLFLLEWMPVEEAKARWPKMAEEIKADDMYSKFYLDNNRTLTEDVCIRTMYHKPCRNLPNGYYCMTTQHNFLEEGRYPYDHTYLPCIRGTDIEAPGELHGISFIQNLASLQHALNNSTSMILQNQALFAYPKYAAPRGAKVRFRELDDDRGIYEYSGPRPPELVAPNSTPGDTWKWAQMLQDHMKTLSGIYATSEGRAPDGITANVALRMIDEQERKFRKPTIDKHNENVQRLAEMLLSTLGTYRDPSDGAMIQVLGKNNERNLRYFDVFNLSRPTEVKLLRSSGLPDSPAARTQTVLDLADRFKDLWGSEEILEYLDIQRPEKLVESATVARQSAESEVEDLLQGNPVPPPTAYQDLIAKYAVYMKAMQSRSFEEVHPQIKQLFISHVMAAEYLMMQKAKNPAFAQLLLQKYPAFPMVMAPAPVPPQGGMVPPIPPPVPPMPMGMPGAPPLGGVPPEMGAPGAPAAPPMNDMGPPPPAPEAPNAPPEQSIPPSPAGNLP